VSNTEPLTAETSWLSVATRLLGTIRLCVRLLPASNGLCCAQRTFGSSRTPVANEHREVPYREGLIDDIRFRAAQLHTYERAKRKAKLRELIEPVPY
jgi:hypothetical protein